VTVFKTDNKKLGTGKIFYLQNVVTGIPDFRDSSKFFQMFLYKE